MSFIIGQIVRGINSGIFIVLGFRNIRGENCVELCEVNECNHKPIPGKKVALSPDVLEPSER